MACWFVHLYRIREHLFSAGRLVGWLAGRVTAFSDSRILKIIKFGRNTCVRPLRHKDRGATGRRNEIVYNTCINSHISSVNPDLSGPFVFLQPCRVPASDPRPDRTELGRESLATTLGSPVYKRPCVSHGMVYSVLSSIALRAPPGGIEFLTKTTALLMTTVPRPWGLAWFGTHGRSLVGHPPLTCFGRGSRHGRAHAGVAPNLSWFTLETRPTLHLQQGNDEIPAGRLGHSIPHPHADPALAPQS